MAIGNAVEKDGRVTVYDENGHYLFVKIGGLHGFTASTVSVRADGRITTYDDKGAYKFTKTA